MPLSSEALHCGSSIAHCPEAVWQYNAGVAPPTTPGTLQRCIAEVPLPAIPRQRGSALQDLHCPLAPMQCGSALEELHYPLPPGIVAQQCKSCSAHCPWTLGQCNAGDPLPAAPGQ